MPETKKEEKRNRDIAWAACQYSRMVIREGCTQIKNNGYSDEKQRGLQKAIDDVRKKTNESTSAIFNIDWGYYTHFFEKRIAMHYKYSLGNCHDMAMIALDYVLQYAPDVDAQIYGLSPGDHVFLIVGSLDQDRELQNPLTWGEAVYFCDPWSKDVYLAKDYRLHLNAYRYTISEGGRYKNELVEFSSRAHKFVPIRNMNSHFLQKRNMYDNLQTVFLLFHARISIIEQAISHYVKNLKRIENYFADDRITVFQNKQRDISKLSEIILWTRTPKYGEYFSIWLSHYPIQFRYRTMTQQLRYLLRVIIEAICDTIKLSHEEKIKLSGELQVTHFYMTHRVSPLVCVYGVMWMLKKEIFPETKDRPYFVPLMR